MVAPSRADVAVIGAGPHALAAIAHLRAAAIDAAVFGNPFDFWLKRMPEGMFLRSSYRACYIADPDGRLTFAEYERVHGVKAEDGPVSIDRFVNYGLWFQHSVAPDVDTRRVVRLDRANDRFSLLLSDGATFLADRVVVAAGIAPFAWIPPEYSALSEDLVSHTSHHRTFDMFDGRRVLVVGAGQSALESAALLHEAGADVEVVARGPAFRWNPTANAGAQVRRPALVKRIRHRLHYLKYPPHDVGPPPWNWLVASPDIWRVLPARFQPIVEYKVNYPRGASWLFDRLVGVSLGTGLQVLAATPQGDGVCVTLSDGTDRLVDHIVLGTGYRVDVSRYDFLSKDILRSLRLEDGYPVLGRGMDSSIPGLHFLGAPAARSHGPVMRFVSGSAYGARALTRRILGRRSPLVDFSW
jgi:thioredoxin reductase